MTGRRILVVDDDEGIRTLYRALLKRRGYEADFASDGEEAVASIARQPYDVVVLDLMMRVAGSAVIATLEKNAPLSPCVIVVSAASEKAIETLSSPVIYARFRKPFEIDDLLAAIDTCGRRNVEGP